jgi:hypothetical protein
MDFDGDSGVDLADFDLFLATYDQTIADCNANGQPDLREILSSPGLDANGNGVLDFCEHPGDVTGDFTVNIDDILLVIANWNASGPPGTVPGDANANGIVDIDDILLVIAHWS